MIVLIVGNAVVAWIGVLFFLRCARTKEGLAYILLSSLPGGILLLGCSWMLSIQMVLSFFVALGAMPFRADQRWVRKLLVAAPFVSLTVVVVSAGTVPRLRELARLRLEFPMESLESRLAPEAGEVTSPGNGNVPNAALANAVEQSLQASSHESPSSIREMLLKNLHAGTTDQFVIASGFGPVRMLMPTRNRIMLPDRGSIPFERRVTERESRFDSRGSVQENTDEFVPVPPPSPADLTQMHFNGAGDFLHPIRWGYIRDRRHVAGFVSHRFNQMPGTELSHPRVEKSISAAESSVVVRETWRRNWAIVRIELIGLLRLPEPVAYRSPHLPQLDELSSYPTRELDSFETSALTQLRTDEDVIIDETPRSIRMIGSLRAYSDCLKCHHAARGELLGALSYELRPE